MALALGAEALRQRPAQEAVHLGDVGGRGREPGADRPHRLVGDDGVAGGRACRAASPRAGARPPPSVSPARRSPAVSPTHTMAVRPARCAASALALTSRSRSPWSARRSEWPTITAVAPASFSISAEMSPVWAPLGRGMAVLAADQQARAGASRGQRGDQRRRRADHGVDAAAQSPPRPAGRARARASPSAAASPFIFQLPATSGRTRDRRCHARCLVPSSLDACPPASARDAEAALRADRWVHNMPRVRVKARKNLDDRPRPPVSADSRRRAPPGSNLEKSPCSMQCDAAR